MAARFTLHVPLALNSGEPVRPEYLDGVGRMLADTFGGFTRVDAVGGWIGDRLYTEPMALFHVDVDRAEDATSVLMDYARFLAEALAQECVYLTSQPITTWLVAPQPVEA